MKPQYTLKITGMHCASCAGIIEKTLKKIEGVESVIVNYASETLSISFDKKPIPTNILSSFTEKLGYSLSDRQTEEKIPSPTNTKHENIEIKEMKSTVISALPLAGISIIAMTWETLAQLNFVAEMPMVWEEFFHHLLPIIATYILFIIGKPYLLGVYRFFRFGSANMDTLIGIGTSVAFIYSFIISAFEDTLQPFLGENHTYYDVTIIVITFVALGKYLEMRSKQKTGDAIKLLLTLQAKTAIVVRNGVEQEIPIEEVVTGDHIIIKPAGKIPVDGTIIEGSSYIDESMITGEPMPVGKHVNDSVIAGTLNTTGSFTLIANKIGPETMLAHIIKMVTDAQNSKAPIQAMADKISSIFVPIILGIAGLTLLTWLTLGTYFLGLSQGLSFGLITFVSILVIACPCALGLATPTAIIVGVGKGAKEGILIKDAATLETLHKAKIVVVDKTGTVTEGKPTVSSINNYSQKEEKEIISIIASLEKKSEHPIAHALISYADNIQAPILPVDKFEIIKGKGLQGTIDTTKYFIGNTTLIKDLGHYFDEKTIEAETKQGKTPVILATQETILAIIMISDTIKPQATKAIKDIHNLGIRVIMLTGDNKNTSTYIASLAGITEVVAEVLPQDKQEHIRRLQENGDIVAMMGDGVNDAPALAQANVGIAMGNGTDVAIESAGITLLHGDISKLIKAIKLSRYTMRGIKQNLFWAFIYNIIGIPLASGLFYPIFGWLLNPIFAGFAMAASSVSVVTNSLRIKSKKL